MNLVARITPVGREIASGEFRNAMRHLTGGVSVITAGRGSDISGITVTSVSSLAIEPPVLTVAINRKASTLPLLPQYGAFGINILSANRPVLPSNLPAKMGVRERSALATFRGPQGLWVNPCSGMRWLPWLRSRRNHRTLTLSRFAALLIW